jgi:hypothetical protein
MGHSMGGGHQERAVREPGGSRLRRAVTAPSYACAIYNYSADAGQGSAIFTHTDARNWRAVLLGTAAAGALWFGTLRSAQAAPDACLLAGGIATCTGDQSDGITSGALAPPADFPDTYTTLNVNTLNTDITPAPTR